ncbi:unnamed protein product [Peronospora destructor]|uniref:Uncharacterized protein n=1 Tax=Peronospora destructor TaxID=86335 RepID=A0AAV0TT18_9STRA|nr:unnamed protein product [Peronospora destructor]
MNEVNLDEFEDSHYENAFAVKVINGLPFAGLEQRLLDFVQEAARIDGTQESDIEGSKAVNVTNKSKHQDA